MKHLTEPVPISDPINGLVVAFEANALNREEGLHFQYLTLLEVATAPRVTTFDIIDADIAAAALKEPAAMGVAERLCAGAPEVFAAYQGIIGQAIELLAGQQAAPIQPSEQAPSRAFRHWQASTGESDAQAVA